MQSEKAIRFEQCGWGMTTGQGLVRKGKSYTTRPRKIFVKPLSRDFCFLLCSEQLKGREQQ
mgnify:CR=1 FL=1